MKYIAHRGYSKHETENTIASAELAGQKDYFYGIEYDIHLTKDNKFVVHHDYTTVRLGNIELDLKSSTYDELLENVKLVNINTKEFEHKIPLLDEYIDICNKYDKVNIIEIKPNFNEEEIKMFYEAIKKANKKVVISFGLNNLLMLRKLDPTLSLQFLTGEFNTNYFDTCKANNIDLDINYGLLLNDEYVKYFKENKFIINTWTVDDVTLSDKFREMQIDYLTTNGLSEYK